MAHLLSPFRSSDTCLAHGGWSSLHNHEIIAPHRSANEGLERRLFGPEFTTSPFPEPAHLLRDFLTEIHSTNIREASSTCQARSSYALFEPFHNPMQQVVLSSQFTDEETKALRDQSNLPKTTQPVSEGCRRQTQANRAQRQTSEQSDEWSHRSHKERALAFSATTQPPTLTSRWPGTEHTCALAHIDAHAHARTHSSWEKPLWDSTFQTTLSL